MEVGTFEFEKRFNFACLPNNEETEFPLGEVVQFPSKYFAMTVILVAERQTDSDFKF